MPVINELKQKIQAQIKTNGKKLAIRSETSNITYEQLISQTDQLWADIVKFIQAGHSGVNPEEQQVLTKGGFAENSAKSFAFLMDNHPAWAILDLTLLFNHQCAVPLPRFFSNEQLLHSLKDSNADFLIVDKSPLTRKLLESLSHKVLEQIDFQLAGKELCFCFLNDNKKTIETSASTSHYLIKTKVTYTSGTTSQPKGVILSETAIMEKVKALALACEVTEKDRALSILPLSTLLENIAGLYVPLYCGATATIVSPQTTGMSGSSQIDHERLMSCILNYQPTAFVIIPQLLALLINLTSNGYKLPESVRFIALGGAPVSAQLLAMAEQLKIPVFEGYGLSEAASVVSVNRPGNKRIGSVGQVLNSHQVKINQKYQNEGEILVKNNLFNGYLGHEEMDSSRYYATGDIGKLDDDGFLYITGRKKNIINTAFGRNISPEWIEKELDAIPEIAQSVIYGHGKPYLVAIIVPRLSATAETTTISQIVIRLKSKLEQLNLSLPDYARINDFILLDEPFTVQNNQLTGTGRPRREVIYQVYQNEINQCYESRNPESQVCGAQNYKTKVI
jgi:long-subunit acyl-CoA synthetase (AMP-forming)